ncbi:histidine phosphatase family protein [Pseudalkalibacillus salsuginis]|uniref:histidine phosphatase family protein n=1 Tax=Pseudalkalibacillus salsuginis TaxID=2910972 RepID=UPI001F3F8A30|nr:histidine phosphatase family protein [Pseudalkalibacillus salsuginis]MCF6410838.1 histidine phosphatase family protein [Pseudalkalibacillus salsuginis]
MTKIAFIRHGVTDWNLEARAQGQSDIPLNEEGLLQAKALGRRFTGEEWDTVYSSDLIRAKVTAEAIGNVLNLPVQTDERLREIYFGDIEGTIEEERVERWGEHWRDLDLHFEKEENILVRIKSFMNEITNKHTDGRVIVVSHGAFLNDMFTYLLEDYERCRFGNTSVSIFKFVDKKWETELLNCSAHLQTMEGQKI